MGFSILRVMTKFNKVLFSLLIFFGLTLLSSSAIAKEDRVSRGDFVQMLARHNSENALLPKNHSDLSKDELYIQIVEALKIKGFNVLADKPINDPLKTLEFVRITYAFTGAPSGTSLFEQKLYLKKAGIIKSADIGLATGIEGEVIQYHKGEISLERIIEKMCHAPAKCFQVQKRGFIKEGYWADLVLIDPEAKTTVDTNNTYYKCGWSPFDGHTFNSAITHTFVNGYLVYHNGVFDDSVKGQRLLFER